MNRFRCAVLVIVFYVLAVFVLYLPLIKVCFGDFNIVEVLFSPLTHIFFGLILLIQILMLWVPIEDSTRYKLKKRHLAVPIITAGLIFGILVLGIFSSIWVGIFGDKDHEPGGRELCLVLSIVIFLLSWIFWALRFRKYWLETKNAGLFMKKTCRTIRRGCLLEWLVAIPCHIIVRWRGDCSAPAVTFAAIIMGVAICFLSFGPGLYYVFMARMQNYQKKDKTRPPDLLPALNGK